MRQNDFNLQNVSWFNAINPLQLHITGCSLLNFMSQGPQVTPSLFMMVNHFPLKIKIMTDGPKTVPGTFTEPGGTFPVTVLT